MVYIFFSLFFLIKPVIETIPTGQMEPPKMAHSHPVASKDVDRRTPNLFAGMTEEVPTTKVK